MRDLADIPWLLILDGADNEDGFDVLKEYLPPVGSHGSILITSRDALLVSRYGGAVLGPLAENEAIDLLSRSAGSADPTHLRYGDSPRLDPADTKTVSIIVRLLGNLPIGITQAAQLIEKDEMSFTEFLDAYNDGDLIRRTESLRMDRAVDYPFNLSTVWTMSYRSLGQDQQDLLNILSFYDHVGIPLNLISEGSERLSAAGNKSFSFLDTNKEFRACKSSLVRSSLVMQNEYLDQLWMHKLVQQSCHSRMDTETRQKAFERAFELLEAMWPVPDRDSRHRIDLWPLQSALFPAVQSLMRWYQLSWSSRTPLQATQRIISLIYEAAL